MESENINNNIETNPIYNKIENLHDKIKVDLNNVLVIFVNPISGNQEGKIFLQIAKNYQTKEGYKIIDFSLIKSSDSKIKYEPFKAVFFKLIDKGEFNKGLELIRTYQESISHGEVVKTIIAGGDGTVLSIIQQLDKEGIDVNKCIFGHIPLGTGNDLSNSLGFSNHVDIKNNVDSLYKILLKYQKALLGRVDVWDMELKLDEKNGEILENTKKGKIQKKDENGNIIRLYKRTFINYLSLGYDARVGYNFDKNRTSSRLGNKCIYFWEGLKKNCCRTTINIAGFLESFTVYSDPEQSINQPSFDTFDNNDDNENIDIKFMFKSKFALTEEEKNKKCIVIRGEPCSIVCQNINLYMAGVKDIWKNGKENMSIKLLNGTKEDEKIYEEKFKKMANQEQKLDDKQLEFFTFDSGMKTGLEKVIGGLAKKIYHGRGPILMKFKETPALHEEDKKNRIYLNVDGEYFHIVCPISLKIQINKNLCNGQIPFLINKKK